MFGQYPDIKIINEVNANWDQAQGQQAMQNLLATYPNIDGVWVQDGMAAGAWRAIIASKKTDIAATGEIRKDFLESWSKNEFNTGASVNPPGVMASALNVAVHALMGKKLKPTNEGVYGNAYYLPIPFIDRSNFAEALSGASGKPAYYSVSSSLTIQEALRFFK